MVRERLLIVNFCMDVPVPYYVSGVLYGWYLDFKLRVRVRAVPAIHRFLKRYRINV